MTKAQAWLVGGLFFFSGLTSLVYETLWIRVLSLGVGSTSTSMSIVLSIFFLGLSLGSWVAGRIVSRIQSPVRVYGWIEGLIGLYSFALIYLLFDFHRILGLLPLSQSLSVVGLVLKFLWVFAVLLLPTTLMGASLPFLIRIFVRSDQDLGKTISLLYGVNTLGGVTGAALTGFVLIPKFGVLTANHASAVVNVLILIIALLLAKHLPKSAQKKISVAGTATKKKEGSSRFGNWVSISVGITGFCALVAQVVWNKYLGIYLGSNIFGLSLILALFLSGIAIGALILAAYVDRVARPELFYVDLVLVCALSLVLTSVGLGYAPVISNVVSYYFPNLALLTVKTWVAAVLLILPSSALGALLPMAIRLKVDGFQNAPQVTGQIYALNTLGSILGSGLAGLVLLPLWGSALTLRMATVILIACGLLLLWSARPSPWRWIARAAGFVAVLLMVAGMRGISFQNIIKSAYHQHASQDMSLADVTRYFARTYEEFKLIVEGRTGIISLSHDPQDGENFRDYLRLKTNGLNESVYTLSNLEALPKYEALLGLLPFSLARNPERAFTVGYGGGYTVDFLTTTDIRDVQVVELEDGIIQAASYVYKGVNPILRRDSLNLRIEDARYILANRKDRPYDIIVSQPSHSWLAGVANLFTLEFFEIVKGNLSEGGVFSQWLNLYNMNPEVLKSILRTFYTAFPHGAVFTGAGDQEMIMIGTKLPLRFQVNKLHALATNPKFRRQLSYIPMETGYDLLALFAIGREDVLKLSEGAPLNTDRNAYAEVMQSRLFYSKTQTDPNQFLLRHYSGDFSSILPASAITADLYRGILDSMSTHGQDFYKSNVLLKKLEESTSTSANVKLATAQYALRAERYHTARQLLEEILPRKPDASILNSLLGTLLTIGDVEAAYLEWRSHPRARDRVTSCYELELFTRKKMWSEAEALVRRFSTDAQRARCGIYIQKALGLYYAERSNFAAAKTALEPYYSEASQDFSVYRALLASYLMTGDRENSESFAKSFAEALQHEQNRLKVLAEFYESQGYAKDADVLRQRGENL